LVGIIQKDNWQQGRV